MFNFLTVVFFSVVFFVLGDIVGTEKLIEVCNQIVSNFK
jgi:hypothetical protein